MESLRTQPVAIFSDTAEARYDIHAGLGWADISRLAIQDLREAASMWRLAWTLSVLDIKLRYRGSLLGPFWLTISASVMIGTMGIVYSYLFRTELKGYFTYLSLSIIAWTFISGLMTEGCNTFIQAESVIKGMKLPLSLNAMRTVLRNLIILAHNVVVVIAVFLIFGVTLNRFSVLAIPGFLLWLMDGFLVSLLFGIFCTRFRDVPQIIASVIQIVFFVTPIMWQPSLVKGHAVVSMIIALNPFEALLHIVRAPLLGEHIGLLAWTDALFSSALLFAVTFLVFARLRGRIAFWV